MCSKARTIQSFTTTMLPHTKCVYLYSFGSEKCDNIRGNMPFTASKLQDITMCRTVDNNEHKMQSPKLKGYTVYITALHSTTRFSNANIKRILTILERIAGKNEF